VLDVKLKEDFRQWLFGNTTFSEKVVRDTLSRLSRLSEITALNIEQPVDEFIFKLDQNEYFGGLSMSVRSQLKRSYKLFKEFSDGRSVKK